MSCPLRSDGQELARMSLPYVTTAGHRSRHTKEFFHG